MPGVEDVKVVEEAEEDAGEEDEDESERVLRLTLAGGRQLHVCADESSRPVLELTAAYHPEGLELKPFRMSESQVC